MNQLWPQPFNTRANLAEEDATYENEDLIVDKLEELANKKVNTQKYELEPHSKGFRRREFLLKKGVEYAIIGFWRKEKAAFSCYRYFFVPNPVKMFKT